MSAMTCLYISGITTVTVAFAKTGTFSHFRRVASDRTPILCVGDEQTNFELGLNKIALHSWQSDDTEQVKNTVFPKRVIKVRTFSGLPVVFHSSDAERISLNYYIVMGGAVA